MMSDNRTVLLVEDNEKLNEINRRTLEGEGYTVLSAPTLAEAREHLSHHAPDVILLDVVLPDGSGFDFCDEIRGLTKAHIIFLTSRRDFEDKMNGMQLGGDNYLTKPYKLEEMLIHVAAAMRRREIDAEPIQTIIKDNLTLDILASLAFVDGADLLLTQKEFALLALFTQNEGRSIGVEYIYEKVWGQPMNDNNNAIKVMVSKLRTKLTESSYTISSKRGEGYCFEKVK